ncbi:hypothetical protein AFM11_34350 [Mycolicibacterium wolinskyi]|uniref:Uncharacterized protein n=1 Tax=Mycolicibacterium wolinskyi TaxID=59750 RepID=A0A132PBM8_9MYCO|nr:hypothetical protein [Mycolicibacterium wolinskyi]KWX19726.1 hypothetical protein AFM11_34350 [Mycolicibacterium wolinskyi]
MRAPDEPQFNVCPNASRPGLVHFSIGSGRDLFAITPELAEHLADELLAAAGAARRASGSEGEIARAAAEVARAR